MEDSDKDAARLALEREKWQSERAFRERELALKERDQKMSSWTNPLTVAVSVAALAWCGNVIATWWNGRLQRALEEQKATQSLRLEESKAESERIFEMIKTGDPGTAATNLKFLLDAGLVASAERVEMLRTYLEKTPPSSGPALPAAGTRFSIEQSGALPGAAAAALQNNLNTFIAYLDTIGFGTTTEHVQVRVEKLPSPNAEYHPGEKMILIDQRIIDDPYPAHREYMHHLLLSSKAGANWTSAIGGLQSGLADYFSASFSGNPQLATAQTASVLGLDRPFIRRLDNDLKYAAYRPGDQPHAYGEVWGGAFWDMRRELGPNSTDKMLVQAWQSMSWPVEESEIAGSFLTSLMQAAKDVGGEAAVEKVRGTLQARNVPILSGP